MRLGKQRNYTGCFISAGVGEQSCLRPGDALADHDLASESILRHTTLHRRAAQRHNDAAMTTISPGQLSVLADAADADLKLTCAALREVTP